MPSPLASFVFWAAVLCCVVAEAAIVRSAAVAGGALGAGDVAEGAPTAGLPRMRRGAEVLWAVLPALVLAGVLAWTWRTMHAAPDAERPASSAAASDAAPPPAGSPPAARAVP